jgi:hypothetical protein
VIGGVFEVLQRRIREAGGCAASAIFGRGRSRWIAARLNRGGGQGGAPVWGEEVRGEERGSGSLSLPILCGNACRCVGLRRGIPSAWRRLERKNEREMGEECWGLL